MNIRRPWLLLGLALLTFWPRAAWSNVSHAGVAVSSSSPSVPHAGLARLGDFATLLGMHPKAVVASQTSFTTARGRHSGLSVSALHKPAIYASAHLAPGVHVVSRRGTVHTPRTTNGAHFQVVKTSANSAQVVQDPVPVITTGTASLTASASAGTGFVSGASLMSHGSPVVHTTAADPPPGTFNGPTFSLAVPRAGGLTPGIPEPSAIVLLATGGLLVGGYGMRRKRRWAAAR